MSKKFGPQPLDVPWIEIRDAYLLGVPSSVIGAKYGLPSGTIRMRAHREKWPTPRNIREKMKAAPSDLVAKAAPEQGMLQVAVTVEELAAQHRSMVATKVNEKVRKGLERIRPPKTWRDMQTADAMARRSLGLDTNSPETVVNIGIVGASPGIRDLNSD